MAKQTSEYPKPGDTVRCDGCGKGGYWDAYENGVKLPATWREAHAKWIILTLCADCADRWLAWRLVWVDENGNPVTPLNELSGDVVRAEDM